MSGLDGLGWPNPEDEPKRHMNHLIHGLSDIALDGAIRHLEFGSTWAQRLHALLSEKKRRERVRMADAANFLPNFPPMPVPTKPVETQSTHSDEDKNETSVGLLLNAQVEARDK